MLRLKGLSQEKRFLETVIEHSGQNLLACLQCGKCSGSCPITSDTVNGPRHLIAQILAGMRLASLTNATWWYCVSCGTCAGRCPVEINMYQVATTLCEMAEAAGVQPSERAIHQFEALFLKSVRHNGRVQELKTVAEFNLRRLDPFKDALKGMQLMARGAIDPRSVLAAGRRRPEPLHV